MTLRAPRDAAPPASLTLGGSEAATTGAFVVPPPAPLGATAMSRSWPASIGQVSGVAFELDGRHAWVFHRSRVWRAGSFDASFAVAEKRLIAEHTVARLCLTTGRIVRQFGANEHYMPHGLTLAPNGDVWVTDVGAHVVIRYDAGGRRLATFGGKNTLETLEKNDEPPAPTRRARATFPWARTLRVLHAHGRGSRAGRHVLGQRRVLQHRVAARFDADGAFADEWGPRGTEIANGVSGFDVPHSIALISARAAVVADRERARVTEHALDGMPLAAHDFGEHGYVYHVATLAAEDDGMSGFYALDGTRGDGKFEKKASRNATAPRWRARLLAVWDDGGVGLKSTRLARWDLPFASVPHAIDVVGGGVGGTRAWGRGVSLFVTETGEREQGDASLHRVWLGERFDARKRRGRARPGVDARRFAGRGGGRRVDRERRRGDDDGVERGPESSGFSRRDGKELRAARSARRRGRRPRRRFEMNDEDYEDADTEASARRRAAAARAVSGAQTGRRGERADRREPNLHQRKPRVASARSVVTGGAVVGGGPLELLSTAHGGGLTTWGRARGRRDSRAREEPRRAGLEMT